MNHDEILLHLRNSAAIKLLQSQNAPLILGFLYDQFKRKSNVTVPHSRLGERLDAYLEALHDAYPDRYRGSAGHYLRVWCDEEHRFLRRYYETGSDDPVYELTPETERALVWVEELQKSEFVGAESRFLRIFDLLQEMVTYGSQDAAARLAQLEAEKDRIQAEIDQIEATGEMEGFSQTQIKERFFEANDVARRLLADFREVEENFRAIARQVQAQQLEAEARKGQIVEQVLAADAALKESDQGRSFYTFWEFLISAQQQERLQELLTAVYRLPEIEQTDQTGGRRLRRIKRELVDAGAKIVASNRRLAEQLRKLLDEQNLAEARRVMALAGAIKQTAVSLRAAPPQEKEFIAIDGDPAIDLPLARPLWTPSTTPTFEAVEPEAGLVDLTAVDLHELYTQFYVDESRLRRRVAALLEEKSRVTLGEVTAVYPLQQGLSELLTYVALAARAERHEIDKERWEQVVLGSNGRVVRLPLVIYRKEPQRHEEHKGQKGDNL